MFPSTPFVDSSPSSGYFTPWLPVKRWGNPQARKKTHVHAPAIARARHACAARVRSCASRPTTDRPRRDEQSAAGLTRPARGAPRAINPCLRAPPRPSGALPLRTRGTGTSTFMTTPATARTPATTRAPASFRSTAGRWALAGAGEPAEGKLGTAGRFGGGG